MMRQHFTSESVSAGHPDKLADQISDTLLDAFLAHDPKAKVACETFVANELVVIGGEARATPPDLVAEIKAHAPALIRQLLWDIGYRSNIPAIDPDHCAIQLALNEQSDDIHRGVERAGGIIGAGDQGLMFGYACDETPELMPLPIQLAHKLMQRHAEVRRTGALPWLRPDAKTQVTVRYEDDKPVDIATVVLSSQHAQRVSQKKLRQAIIEEIVEPVIPAELRAPDIIYRINPTGRFITGGPKSDAGLTGRKIIVDTYGGRCPHGGGAFSGKDPTKVDRSAAYMTRYIAKNIVAAKLARRCTVQLAYAIGVPDPVSICVDLHGTGDVDSTELEAALPKLFDLSPRGIIDTLNLRRPIYAQTAVYGHFGRELEDFTWERIDKAELLAERFKPQKRPVRLAEPAPAIKSLLVPEPHKVQHGLAFHKLDRS